jgi:hypothetical protein
LLEATSTEISSGPEYSPRANRVRDILRGLNLPGYLIAIDEVTEGLKDLRKTRLATHIADGIQAAAPGYATDSISIPLLTTTDGWRIKLTALPTARYGTRRRWILAQEANGRRGLSYPLLDSLKKKSSWYGNDLAMPYVIAVNSSDAMLTDRRFKETLYGGKREVTDSRVARGFWGTAKSPTRRHVSAVLFTQNLWPETLLMGQVHTCLYLKLVGPGSARSPRALVQSQINV